MDIVFFIDTATTEIYTLSLPDALPISAQRRAYAPCADERRPCANCGYGQRPAKTVALIRGVQFTGEIRRLGEEESAEPRARYNRRFPVARVLSAPMWEIRLSELKFTDNTLGFGKKLHWTRDSGAQDT